MLSQPVKVLEKKNCGLGKLGTLLLYAAASAVAARFGTAKDVSRDLNSVA